MTERQITIAGKTHPVKFTLKAIKTYEQLTGKNLLTENYTHITNLSLGVDSLIAFVYAGIESGTIEKLTITREDIERNLGIDFTAYNELVQAYIDFIPGLRTLYDTVAKDEVFAKKLIEAANDEEKIKQLYEEAYSSTINKEGLPNVSTPQTEGVKV